MDKRRQSILKPDGRMPLQETVIPDFPEEDTATVTVTKSRRVSFGANFVKEFIVGSAVSAQFFSEYEQAFSSSDSSNPNSSRSGILDRSTFQCEDDALNLCVKPTNHAESSPLKKKFCYEKMNSYSEINERNNENMDMWDFNVGNGSNIFTDKNTSYLNKPDPLRNSVQWNKKVNSPNDSLTMEKQFQNKRKESELNNSKMNETLEKKTKVGKFSSTIFFSADSPTADVEFTEGCITLAKSIFDKKKKEMTVYIKGKSKEDEKDGNSTVLFESEDSVGGMKVTKCADESELECDSSTGNFSHYFPIRKGTDPIEDFDESHENIENVPIHMYSMSAMLGHGENSQSDAELEKSVFFPEKSLTEMLGSDTLKSTMMEVSSMERDDEEECYMDISSSDALETPIINSDLETGKEEVSGDIVEPPPILHSPCVDEEDEDCTSPIFSKVTVGDDLSLNSEEVTESELLMADPLKMSMCEDSSPSENGGSDLELSNCCNLKMSAGAAEEIAEDAMEVSQSSLHEDFTVKEESEKSPSPENSLVGGSPLKEADCLPAEENKESETITSPKMTEPARCSLTKEDIEESLISDSSKLFTPEKSSISESLPLDIPDDAVLETPKGISEANPEIEDPLHTSEEVNREMDGSLSLDRAASIDIPKDITESDMEIPEGNLAELPASNPLHEYEMDLSDEKNSGDEENESMGMEIRKESSFLEVKEMSTVFDTSKRAASECCLSEVEENLECPTVNSVALPEETLETESPAIELMCELNISNEKSSSDVNIQEETYQVTYIAEQCEKSCLQETRYGESSFLSSSSSDADDQSSLGDRKILSLLAEQSEESNCCWTIDSINHGEGKNTWTFSFPILKSSALVNFKLRPSADKSLISFSSILDCALSLRESNEYQLEKHRIGIDFAFAKLKSHFEREIRGLDNVHKMPLFLDNVNLYMRKLNGILRQLIRILKDYPGSQLKESVLTFRLYSLPLLFSYLVSIDLTDPLLLSENSVSLRKHFGNFNLEKAKSIFKDCLREEDFLIRYIRTLTDSVIGMEREMGSITRRSHIRLIRE